MEESKRGGREKEGSALFRAAVHVRVIRGKFVTADWLHHSTTVLADERASSLSRHTRPFSFFSFLFGFFFFFFFFISSAISALPTTRRYSFPFLRGSFRGKIDSTDA